MTVTQTAHLGLCVDLVEDFEGYAWFIVELHPNDEEVELVVSLETYDRPSDAMRAGEKTLAAMFPLPPSPLSNP